ncbi:MAG: hypothetical protein ACXW4A_10160 [Nitrospira sp.]
MRQRFKRILHDSLIYDSINRIRNWQEWWLWRRGRLNHIPHYLKRDILRHYARMYRLGSFVETGTYFGEMVNALRGEFEQIQSIELDDFLFERAKRRFRNCSHIRILHGNSASMLPLALASVDQPTLFWLDAHYSGGITACGDQHSPILLELDHIFHHPIRGHVIVIDDARLFGTDLGYPTLEQVQHFIDAQSTPRKLEVMDDAIRIYEA